MRTAATILATALGLAPALAATPAPTPPPTTIPEKIAPGAKPTGPSENLSRKLDQSGGVIHPGADPDPGIQKPAPTTGDPSVIPPPGSPGGKPTPTPK
jgi:hypothetical protein